MRGWHGGDGGDGRGVRRRRRGRKGPARSGLDPQARAVVRHDERWRRRALWEHGARVGRRQRLELRLVRGRFFCDEIRR